MPNPRSFFVASALSLTAMTAASAATPPPPTRVDAAKDVLHGVEVPDPYRWLEDQESPETRAWIEAQNNHTLQVLKDQPGSDKLRARLTELLKIDTISAPASRDGRYFFSKRRADQDLSVLYMRKGLKGEDQVLVDPHGLSADHSKSVAYSAIADDGSIIGYSIREGGADEISVKFIRTADRSELPDALPKARYFGVSLLPDNSGFFYTRHTDEGPRVFFHKMGATGADRLVFGEGYGPEKIISAGVSDNGRWLLISVSYGSAAQKSEIHVQDLKSGGPVKAVVADMDANFWGEIGGDRLFMLSDWKAPNRRILSVELSNPARENWKEVVPTGDLPIQDLSLVGGKVFVKYLENVQPRVRIYTPEGQEAGEIERPAVGTMTSLSGRWDRDEGFFSFSSHTVPPTIYRYDVAKAKRSVWAKINVPVDGKKLETQQVWFTSKDGTKVPMFIVHKKGLKLDGQRPVLMTGYGGFNSALTPGFSSMACIWAEAGGVYAVPSLRGGGEFGEGWHRAGMLGKKQNVFDDFFAAAEWLIANKYTNPEKLAISGGSNGGLLVGAALTQRPELFRAVMCSYPLLDMVRYHKFLVARFWVPEYGSSENAEQFGWLHAYSPYHRVKPGTRYPATLFVTGDADTRVAPLHARKMAALLQKAQGGDAPILLDYNVKAGHSGGRPLSEQIEDLTRQYGFLMAQTGLAL